MSESTIWVFTCPRCGEILTAPKTRPEQPPAEQLKFHGALTLQRHITSRHPELHQSMSNLIGQYALALMVKCFDTTDEAAIATRAHLYDACAKSLTEPWEVPSIVLSPGPQPQKPIVGGQ